MSLFLTPEWRVPSSEDSTLRRATESGTSGTLTIVTERHGAWTVRRDESIEGGRRRLTDAAPAQGARQQPAAGLPLSRTAGDRWTARGRRHIRPGARRLRLHPNNPRRPKFPQAVDLPFLLNQHRRGTVERSLDPLRGFLTLDRMARGGIRDQLGGGITAIDGPLLDCPALEKMLYDNAQLASSTWPRTMAPRTAGQRRRQRVRSAGSRAEDDRTRGASFSALDAETKGWRGADPCLDPPAK